MGGIYLAVQLRDYQREAVAAVLRERDAGTRRQLVALPTGAGKTLVGAALARQVGERTLFLVHRDELAQQALEKFALMWPEAPTGLVKASSDEVDAKVVVASVQTLARHERLERLLRAGVFRLVIADEAHHFTSPMNTAVLEGLGFLPDPGPDKLLVGLTATPYRADGVGLDAVFEKITYRRSIMDMIRRGYLTDVKAYRLDTRLDLSKVRRVRGDFDERDLALAVNTPRRNQAIVAGYRRLADGRRAVAFTVDIQHARDLADTFSGAGIPAAAVWGDMPAQQRRDILRSFRTGDIQVLCNAALLTEGWDEPSVGAVIMARPTRSPVLYVQCVGRGLRLYPGKNECILIDLDDTDHDLCHVGTLAGLPRQSVRQGASLASQTEEAAAAGVVPREDLIDGVRVVVSQVDVLGRSAFVWQKWGDGRLVLRTGPNQRILLVPLDEVHYRVTLWDRDAGETVLSDRLPLGYAQGVAEDYVRAQNLSNFASKDAAWRSKPPTERQLDLLRQLQVPISDGMTREDASAAIEKAFAKARLRDRDAPWRSEPATPKQISWLKRHKFRPRPGMTKGEAADIMDRFFERRRGAAGRR